MKPIVYMMLGLPGSGKTTYSKQLQRNLKILRLSIDEEYSKLGGSLSDSSWDENLATEAGQMIKKKTAVQVSSNRSVILDLCPWKKDKREEYREYIESLDALCHIFYFEVEKTELLRRLKIRNSSGEDSYIISPEMLNDFLNEFDIPSKSEVKKII